MAGRTYTAAFSRAMQRPSLATIGLATLLALPLFGVVAGGFGTPTGTDGASAARLFGLYVPNTLLLLVISCGFSAVIGTVCAWIVAAHSFPGRRIFEWALVLPLALPGYIGAYVYGGLLEYAGPVQMTLRSMTGSELGWFPDVRSLGGAGLLLALVLYPYVYLIARAAFLRRSQTLFQAARVLGAGPFTAFRRIALPTAAPAILGGVMLVGMETAADFGVADYFGVPTFSTGIFRTWYAMGDPVSALRLAASLLALVILLVAVERMSRASDGTLSVTMRATSVRARLRPVHTGLAWLALLCPVVFGFLLPTAVLLHLAIKAGPVTDVSTFMRYATTSLSVASLAAVLACALALLFAYRSRRRSGLAAHPATRYAITLGTLGYALPGTLLAVGILSTLGAFDRLASLWLERSFGMGLGLILSGSGLLLLFAYLVRFVTVSFSSIETGFRLVPVTTDLAAQTLGASPGRILREIHLPLIRPALAAALLLVFIDTLRELPATLLLRPFNFETLATRIYRLASDERLAEASGAALVLVLAGLLPVILVTRLSIRDKT